MLEKEFKVEKEHTARQIGSGDLEVLSTPSLVAFMENVAKEIVESQLKETQTTVGVELNVKHLKATAVGKKVKVRATLTAQNRSILLYNVEAYDGNFMIGKGEHKRAIVDSDQFMKNI